jgi:hypothetical protein
MLLLRLHLWEMQEIEMEMGIIHLLYPTTASAIAGKASKLLTIITQAKRQRLRRTTRLINHSM